MVNVLQSISCQFQVVNFAALPVANWILEVLEAVHKAPGRKVARGASLPEEIT